MHTQKIYEHHESESQLSCTNSKLLYMGVFTYLSALSLLGSSSYNVTIHNEGVYIPFPSCALKLSNLELKSYLPALTILNASYLLRTRVYGSRSRLHLQVWFILMTSFKMAHQFQGVFKTCAGACPAVLHSRTGSLVVRDAPASHDD